MQEYSMANLNQGSHYEKSAVSRWDFILDR